MSPTTSAALSLVALLLALAAIVLATIANRRWAGRTRPASALPADHADLPAGTAAAVPADLPSRAELSALRDQLDALGRHVADLATAAASPPLDPTALRHVALVRYDAFADVGGRLSYSVALLDDTRSGLVLTTLAGKSDVRTYARTISAGAADGTLTAEEQQAIEAAAGPTGSRP